ncbi:MAG: YCF48-related protein, partial [Candidatus Zixiibacteriota bacterium]
MRRLGFWFFLFFMGIMFLKVNYLLAEEYYLVKVELKTEIDLEKIKGTNFETFTRGEKFVLGKADQNILSQLKKSGLLYSILDKEPQSHNYYFVWYRGEEPVSKAKELIESKGRVLYQENDMFLVEGKPEDIEQLPKYKMALKKIFQEPLSIEFPEKEEVLLKAIAYSPVIAGMIAKVKTEDVVGLVKDLSGERAVLIGGLPDSIPTRYTGTEGNYKAAQYLLERFAQMGLEVYPDTFYTPYGGILSDVKAARDGQTAWLCSGRGWILRTTNRGLRWFTVEGTEQFKLNRIFRLTDDTLWAVGSEGLAVNSTDRGASWTEKTKPTTKNLSGIYFESNLSGWVVGDSGKVFYTSDGGTNWIAQVSGTANTLYNITF